MAERIRKLNPLSIYQVFVRNYSKQGTFQALEKDLHRIHAMGFDFIYLTPIHPIGREGRKGSVGSPYSIRDYDAIDASLGGYDGFDSFIQSAHALGMKVMMDIVIHHSSRDHAWVKQYPEFYKRDAHGNLLNDVPDWSDVADFDFSNSKLREKLISMFAHYAKLGVDGYRCDVASLVPLSFWMNARKVIMSINPDFVWLAESVEVGFVQWLRSQGIDALSDTQLAQAFDILYPYDIKDEMYNAFENKDLLPYQKMLRFTLVEYQPHTSKILCLENHDQKRIATVLKNQKNAIMNWTAFSFLMEGTAFVYAGQEAFETKQPSLFEDDPITWSKRDESFESFIARLNQIRKKTLNEIHTTFVFENPNVMEFSECKENQSYYGAFNVNGLHDSVDVHLEDGQYFDLINERIVNVKHHQISSDKLPVYIEVDTKKVLH